MALKTLTNYLDKEDIKYTVLTHSPAYDMDSIATLTQFPLKRLAKSVVVKIDGTLALAVIPASGRVNLDGLRRMCAAREVILASEEEFKGRFPQCETGAMPPFGNLFGMQVFADEKMATEGQIAFNAGTHRELIRMDWDDFNRLVTPRIGKVSRTSPHVYAA